jgi:uncharacterized membrane protein (UPF0127 family)
MNQTRKKVRKDRLQVENLTRRRTLVSKGKVADTIWTRFKGLLLHPPLKPGEGMLIVPSRSIHTFFMRFPIDVLYVNKEHEVVGYQDSLPPWRLGKTHLHSRYVVELPAGTVEKTGTQVGDKIKLQGYRV